VEVQQKAAELLSSMQVVAFLFYEQVMMMMVSESGRSRIGWRTATTTKTTGQRFTPVVVEAACKVGAARRETDGGPRVSDVIRVAARLVGFG
jgi:hypothetical protein